MVNKVNPVFLSIPFFNWTNKVLGVFISIPQMLSLHVEDTIIGIVAENVPKKSPARR
jgi:hypothetical protein